MIFQLQKGAFRSKLAFKGHLQKAGLPDGISSNQKYQFGKILECLAMKDVGKFYVH
jgi:hypothetical protein